MKSRAAAVTLTSSLLAAAALAQPPPALDGERHGPPHRPPHELLIEELDALGVDGETAAQIQEIVDDHAPELDAAREELESLRAAVDAGEMTHEEARASARESLEADRLMVDEILDLLTEEQRAAARALMPPPPHLRRAPPGDERSAEAPEDG